MRYQFGFTPLVWEYASAQPRGPIWIYSARLGVRVSAASWLPDVSCAKSLGGKRGKRGEELLVECDIQPYATKHGFWSNFFHTAVANGGCFVQAKESKSRATWQRLKRQAANALQSKSNECFGATSLARTQDRAIPPSKRTTSWQTFLRPKAQEAATL